MDGRRNFRVRKLRKSRLQKLRLEMELRLPELLREITQNKLKICVKFFANNKHFLKSGVNAHFLLSFCPRA